MIKIFMHSYEILMSVGIHDFEKQEKQRVIVNIEALCDLDIQSDDIAQTVSYADFKNTVDSISTSKHFELLETFAQEIAQSLMQHAAIHDLKVRAEKPDIFDGNPKSVGVEIHKSRS